MDHFTDERDQRLLACDRYTFEVLARILREPCALVRSDHERLVICHSDARHPVWVWTPDGASEADMVRAWDEVQAARPFREGWRYNLKYALAGFFIERARTEGIALETVMRLFAYDCPELIEPAHRADGGLYTCGEGDLEEAFEFIRRFHAAIGEAEIDDAYCRGRAEEYVARRAFFLWKDMEGRPVACCSVKPDGELASIGNVYTDPRFRRRHYAQSLVYEVTKIVMAQGRAPMLYTDADYAASNACYSAIGYVRRGGLCTIGIRQSLDERRS